MVETPKLVDQLRGTLGKLELALGAINDAIVWVNESGLVQWCNTPFDALVGLRHLEALGAKLMELLPLEQEGRALAAESYPAHRALKTPLGDTGLYELQRKGARAVLEIYSVGVQIGEQEPCAILVIRDITERKKAEEALRQAKERAEAAYKDLESFSYSVSHDLRAPLRKINGFSQVMLEDYAEKLDAPGKDLLGRLRAASQGMAQLIDGLLNLSRVARSELSREQVDLSAAAESIAAGLRESQPRREARFVIQPGVLARGDARLLKDVLENLLENAWKFTSKHPRARIEFGAVPCQGRPAYFVRDDGAGFDPAYAGKLFAPFHRLHATGQFPGTGIGLATVRRIIQRHGGRVWAEGALERGATFYFTLANRGDSDG